MRVRSGVRCGLVVAAVAFVSFAAACSLPSRDNPHDPGVRPSAALTLEYGPFDSDTGVCTPSTINPDFGAFSRKNCLRLDASASTDPQSDIASFTYIVRNPATGKLFPNPPVTVTVGSAGVAAASHLDLAPGNLRGLPPNIALEANVMVTDRGGHTNTAGTITFKVSNEKPSVRSPDTRVVPYGGAAWESDAALATLTVPLLGGEAIDADDDPACYCWTPVVVPGDQPALLETAGGFGLGHRFCSPARTRDVPIAASGTAETIVFKLKIVPFVVASDSSCTDDPASGNSCCGRTPQTPDLCNYDQNCSAETFSTLRLAGHPPAWAGVTSESNAFGERAVQIDVDRETVVVPPPGTGRRIAYSFGPLGAPELTRVFSASGDVVSAFVVQSPGTVQQSAPLGFDVFAMQPTGSDLWAWGLSGSGTVAVARLDSATLALQESWSSTVTSTTDIIPGALETTQPRLWLAPAFSSSALVITAGNPAVSVLPAEPDTVFAGVALRGRASPAPEQVWLFEGPDVFNGGTAAPVARVFEAGVEMPPVAFEALPDSTVEFPLTPQFVRPDPHADADVFWTDIVGEGLQAFTLNDLTETAELLTPAPVFTSFPRTFVADPRTGEVVFLSGDRHTLIHVSLDGSTQSVDTPTSVTALGGPDRDGLFWIGQSVDSNPDEVTALARGAATGEDGVIGTFTLPLMLGLPSIDYRSGDLLVGVAIPAGVERIGPGGRVIDEVNALQDTTQPASTLPVPLDPVGFVAADPSTGVWWIAQSPDPTGLGAKRLLKADPGAYRGVSPHAAPYFPQATIDLSGTSESILDAVVGPVTHALTALTIDASAAPQYTLGLHRFSAAGVDSGSITVATPTLPSIDGSSTPRFARDLSNGGVCVLWVDNGVGPVVASYSATGVLRGTHDFGEGASLDSVAASLGECWVSWLGNGVSSLAVFRPAAAPGAQVLTMTLPERGRSIYPLHVDTKEITGPHSAWVGEDSGIERIGIANTGGTPFLVQTGALSGSSTVHFRAP